MYSYEILMFLPVIFQSKNTYFYGILFLMTGKDMIKYFNIR